MYRRIVAAVFLWWAIAQLVGIVVDAANPSTHQQQHRRLRVFSPKIPTQADETFYADDNGSPSPPQEYDALAPSTVSDEKPRYYTPTTADYTDDEFPTTWKQIRQRLKNASFELVPLKEKKAPRTPRKKQKSFNSSSSSSSSHSRQRSPHGTTFDLRRPTPERIAKWFAPPPPSSTSSGAQRHRKRHPQASVSIFNHDSVGMTNPVLQVSLPSTGDDNDHPTTMIHLDSTSNTESVSLASTSTSSSSTASPNFELNDTWIPASSSSTESSKQATAHQWARVLQYKLKPQDPSPEAAETAWWPATSGGSSNAQPQQWRQCLYRRRVGKGQACYERVRDAALQWQFQHTETNEKGILPVAVQQPSPSAQDGDSSSSSSMNDFCLDDQASQHVQSIWSGPHSRGSRRLVTFTTCGFRSRWLPKLYTLNPVMVVYDVLDQRGPGTTYSSTAYATLKGHLLRGEERVTVAMRDNSGFVDIEILSYSRPADGLKAKAAWPLIGNLQSTFFQHQMDYLEQVALPKAPPPAPKKD